MSEKYIRVEDVPKVCDAYRDWDVRQYTIDDLRGHGHWELSPFDGNWMCSKCGNKPYHDNMKNMNYCPNCGAKMDEKIL